ncbi:MAG: hypothetical protein ACRDNJ_02685 [Solirubrobacteraceae bacterium]
MIGARLKRFGVALAAVAAVAAGGSAPAAAADPPPFTQIPGSPSATVDNPSAITFNSAGTMLAVTSHVDDSVSIYSVTKTPGGPVIGQTVTTTQTGDFPFSVAFSPDGRLLAVDDFSIADESQDEINAEVDLYEVDPSNDTLTPAPGSPYVITNNAPFVDLGGPGWVSFNGSGSMLVATGNDQTTVFKVDEQNDSLTETAALGGLGGNSAAFSPDGNLLAVGWSADCCANASVSMYKVDSTTGTLTPVQGSPFGTHATWNTEPLDVPMFSSDGSILVIGSYPLETFAVDQSSGGLTELPGDGIYTSNVPALSPTNLIADLAGSNSLYLTSFDEHTDSSTEVPGSPYALSGSSSADAVAWGDGGALVAVATDTNYEQPGKLYVFSAGPPSATITSPGDDETFGLGETVPTAFACKPAAYAPMPGCTDSNGATGSGGGLNTATLGSHTYTVTATSPDGRVSTSAIHYTVVARPTATISAPQSGGVYVAGEHVPTSFSCSTGAGAPPLSSCSDPNGVTGGSGVLDTTTSGSHTYVVTATSTTGQTDTASIDYSVADPPAVRLSLPRQGAHYTLGTVLGAQFSCIDGAYGPGLSSCTGTSPDGARIDTATVGQHRFTVTARSADGGTATRSVTYRVDPPNRFRLRYVRVRTDGTIQFAAWLPWRGVLAARVAATGGARLASARFAVRRRGVLHARLSPKHVPSAAAVRRMRLVVSFTPRGGSRSTIEVRGLRLGEHLECGRCDVSQSVPRAPASR